jgi:uncharacterized protein involved in exopolysaccharide biosynthesis
MAVVTARPGLPLWSDYQRFVRRHRVRIGALMSLGLLLGFVWSWGQPPTYSATAAVVLVPVPKYVSPSTTALAPPEVTIDTDAQLLHSARVQSAVANVLGTDPAAAADHLSVTAAPHSHVLDVTVSAGSPRDAADAANAAVDALVRVRRATLGSIQLGQVRQLRLFVSNQQTLLSEDLVVPAYDAPSARVRQLSTALRELEDARRTPAESVSPALPPRHADHANTEVPLTSGAMVGLVCGCLLGAARDRTAHARRRRPGPSSAHHRSGDLPDVTNRHEGQRHAD